MPELSSFITEEIGLVVTATDNHNGTYTFHLPDGDVTYSIKHDKNTPSEAAVELLVWRLRYSTALGIIAFRYDT